MEKKKRPGNLPNGSPGPLLPAARFLFPAAAFLVPGRLAGGAPAGGAWLSPRWSLPPAVRFLFARQKEIGKRKTARGNLPKGSPATPSSRPRGAVCPPLDPPASVTWSRYSVQNSRPLSPVQAPGETYASSGRGGMTERLRVITALSETGITTPVRSIPTTAAGGIPPVEGRGAYRCCTRNLRKSPRLTGNPPGEARLLAVSAV